MANNLKVLIAEDCAEFTQDSFSIFKENNMEPIFIAKDGFNVIEAIERHLPDIVIMDLFMPKIDAISVIKSIKSNIMIKSPAFVVLSSFENTVLEREVINEGASYFAHKPFNLRDLIKQILLVYHGNKPYQSISKSKLNTINKDDGQSMEIKVTEILHQIGVPAHIKGYHYLRESIIMSIEDPDIINAVTKQLYPSVAKKFSTTPSRVERAIRHSIEVAWDRGDVDILNSYFGYTIHNGRGKPTNSEFIAMISDKMRLQMKSAS